MKGLIGLLWHSTDARDGIVYNPEDFAAAGGELLVVTLIISWILTYIFRPEFIANNELKDRVGYNNLCVGWDVNPARGVAAPLFALIIFVECRYLQLDFWRADLEPNLTRRQRRAVLLANASSALGWFASIGIFANHADSSPALHTASFLQLVVLSFVAYECNFHEAPQSCHPRGSLLFRIIFGCFASSFAIMAIIQFAMYDEYTKTRGPIPWQAVAFADYGYFACMAVQGYFRPRAASVTTRMTLTSDDDFKVDEEFGLKKAQRYASVRHVKATPNGGTTVSSDDQEPAE
eukprot:TRINITY_DN32612_c0_g1_i1.p1 TRINITY_DN32612_c0_g1~~TRINITY_DN32612_c0_g1_i1.p1  ORF type:complete len:301 (-),score=56.90 TRINITY_DN32612_c0_g1_i1:142-1014(-)